MRFKGAAAATSAVWSEEAERALRFHNCAACEYECVGRIVTKNTRAIALSDMKWLPDAGRTVLRVQEAGTLGSGAELVQNHLPYLAAGRWACTN